MSWEKIELSKIKTLIFQALEENLSYYNDIIMGLPATHLDEKIFPNDSDFLKEAPYLRSFIENPNHIGLHTHRLSMEIFKGTQGIEVDLLRICAEEILKAKENSYDGYIASGGTECNIQALWVYREYYKKIQNATNNAIGVLFSEDTHYSIHKACNILELTPLKIKVEKKSRNLDLDNLKEKIEILSNQKIKHLILVLNMGTTMYGSVDDFNAIVNTLDAYKVDYKIHVDAAFGGFIYPFTNEKNLYNFSNHKIQSISMDAHKLLKAPYGTGIFIIRKGYVENVLTEEAEYIKGLDYTISGSRSGANAIAVWMILNAYGEDGIKNRMNLLIEKTEFLTKFLKELGVSFYRNNFMNIIAIRSEDIPRSICEKYGLEPDTYSGDVQWWKIVMMDHIRWDMISNFKKDMIEYHSISSIEAAESF